MKIIPYTFTIRDLVKDFNNNLNTSEVTAFGGKLNIRPAYQREFVYETKKQQRVIYSLLYKRPINMFYFRIACEGDDIIKEDENGYSLYDGNKLLLTSDKDDKFVKIEDDTKFELFDGQQRLMSICSFIHADFSIDWRGDKNTTFEQLKDEDKNAILDTKIITYLCFGDLSELLDWFETINIQGEPLTQQELRNAVCTGAWLSDAKNYFSRDGYGANSSRYTTYIKGVAKKQEVLEKVLSWKAHAEGFTSKAGDEIKLYMQAHYKESNAKDLIDYFEDVMRWVEYYFISNDDKNKRHLQMNNVKWGYLYNKYRGKVKMSPSAIISLVNELMEDDEVTKRTGIYEYALTCDENGKNGKESLLNLRTFSAKDRRAVWLEQGKTCAKCGEFFSWEEMDAHHIRPWSEGGKTEVSNLQMLCPECHAEITAELNKRNAMLK